MQGKLRCQFLLAGSQKDLSLCANNRCSFERAPSGNAHKGLLDRANVGTHSARIVRLGLFFDSGTLDELKFCYEPLTNIFNLAVINFRRGANGPRRKPLSGDTGASQNALLNRTQLLNCASIIDPGCLERFGRRFQLAPQASICRRPRNQSLLHDVLEDGHHEQRVARPNAGRSGWQIPLGNRHQRTYRKCIWHIDLFKALKTHFMTQIVDYQILLQRFSAGSAK